MSLAVIIVAANGGVRSTACWRALLANPNARLKQTCPPPVSDGPSPLHFIRPFRDQILFVGADKHRNPDLESRLHDKTPICVSDFPIVDRRPASIRRSLPQTANASQPNNLHDFGHRRKYSPSLTVLIPTASNTSFPMARDLASMPRKLRETANTSRIFDLRLSETIQCNLTFYSCPNS